MTYAPGVVAKLNGVVELLTAGNWATAAIVWAHTEPRQGTRTDKGGVNIREKSRKFIH